MVRTSRWASCPRPTALALLAGLLLGTARADEEAPAGRPGVPDPQLQEKINEAIERGAAWLRHEQKSNGGFGGIGAGTEVHHEIGVTGLAGLALLAAGDERGSKSVDAVYAYLKTKDELFGGSGGRSTYDTGILMMFVTSYWRGKEEAAPGAHPRTGRQPKNVCALPADAKRWLQDLVNWLVRVRKPATSTWGYPAHRDDHSNSQYAFLGLRAARDCGAMVPAQVFATTAKTFLERQEQDGPKVPRILINPDPTGRDYVVGHDKARGWSYLQEPFTATGSMTTSGIAVLSICHDALTNPQRSTLYDTKMETAVSRAVQDGFAWLDKHFAVDKNPGIGAAWHFYYLYGLERACVYGARDLLGRHDWYVEGARYLVDEQEGEGRWSTGTMGFDSTFQPSDVVDTAWAILFLARATRPMPVPVPVATPGD